MSNWKPPEKAGASLLKGSKNEWTNRQPDNHPHTQHRHPDGGPWGQGMTDRGHRLLAGTRIEHAPAQKKTRQEEAGR